MLKRIWLTPPLAFARVGGSSTPCVSFSWGPGDDSPDGSGQTSLQLAETIELSADGSARRLTPDRIIFRDAEGIRPVCPYFELHGEWTKRGHAVSGPVTIDRLEDNGIQLRDITWHIHCAQLKAFHYTYDEADRIDAVLVVKGNNTAIHTLHGRSPAKAKQPLVPKNSSLPLGRVQVALPTTEYPEIRLRYYAPAGHAYAPPNVHERIRKANFDLLANREWKKLDMPLERRIINPRSAWATYILERSKLGPLAGPGTSDARNVPDGLFAYLSVGPNPNAVDRHALGLVDDVSDGVITCSVKSRTGTLKAQARIVVGPPDYGPTSRPPISMADGLADRTIRGDARDEHSWTLDELRDIVGDIFERAFETSDLLHKDYQNSRCHQDNTITFDNLGMTSEFEREQVEALLWQDITVNTEPVQKGKASAFHLSEGGERKHRRYNVVRFLEMRFRENPALFETWIRRPLDSNPYFDKRMPALMQGSDTRPWHLTRRQWELVRLWIEKLGQAKEVE